MNVTSYDLNTCDLEPIHTPGRIQPFGMVLAGPIDQLTVTYCSANTTDGLGLPPDQVLGKPFEAIFGTRFADDLGRLADLATLRGQRERLGTYDLSRRAFDVYLHINPNDQVVVELESVDVAAANAPAASVSEMRKLLAAAGLKPTIKEMLDVCTAGLSQITGYDRVMAYQYEQNGDGVVISEALRGDADSFLGLRYPAWDVPEQARALQVKSPLRMLTDVGQTPVPIVTIDVSNPPLDMALAHLRGISPIHVEYLQNMGVGASLTIGLIVDGRLWGMFSCHHQKPRLIKSDLRIGAELFGQMISLLIKQKMDYLASVRRHQAAESREQILANSDATADLIESFGDLAPSLLKVIDADGIAINCEGKTLTHGSTPSVAAIQAIGDHDREREHGVFPMDVLQTSSLVADHDLNESAGALLVRATTIFPIELIYFRDEVTRNITWAGRPEKQMETGPLGPRISPRGSFDAYMEQRAGSCDPWTDADLAAAAELQILLTQITHRGERVQFLRNQDLISHQRKQDLMIAELNHRVRNILALIRSLSRQARASSASLEDYALSLESRISALAEAHDMAVSNAMDGVSLRMLLEAELAPYMDTDSAQVLLNGPAVGLRADVAPLVALVLHEVASNAAKYGPLGGSDGVVQVKWSHSASKLKLTWQEMGGPPVAAPTRHGFGRSLIEKAIPYEFDGAVEIKFDPAGVRLDMELPETNLVEIETEPKVSRSGKLEFIEKAAHGKKALLVEDNVLLAMDMVHTLKRLAAEDVETVATFDAAMKRVALPGFDFVVLDMNLRGTVSFAIAEKLLERDVPFIFVTGYGSAIQLPPHLQHIPALSKPVDEIKLSICVEEMLQP